MEKFSETVIVDDLECFYEVEGTGEPLTPFARLDANDCTVG